MSSLAQSQSSEPGPGIWRDVNVFPPPHKDIMMYTRFGVLITGQWADHYHGFVTHWMYKPASPSKQQGELK